MTLRPFFTSSFVMADPMPELAPVTMATRPDHRCILVRCLQAAVGERRLYINIICDMQERRISYILGN
jgi:hypothetical protein